MFYAISYTMAITDEIIGASNLSSNSEEEIAGLEELIQSGVLYGRKKSKTNPRMTSFIQMTRNGIEIFDAAKVIKVIEIASEFIKGIAQKNGKLLLVGTQPAAKELIKAMAEKFSWPYVTERWLGGTLTNFKTLSQRVNYFIKLKADRAANRLAKYTKKERLQFDREIARMEKLFGGLERLDKLPDALLIVNTVVHDTALREARRLKIPVIGLINSDGDPSLITYPIPANANARSSIKWILEKLEKAAEEGRSSVIHSEETAKS